MTLWYVRGNNMDINEALQVVNSLFDYLSEIGELDKEDFHRMNEAEDVINNYVRKTAATYDKCGMPKQEITFNHRGCETEDNMIVRDKDDVKYE